MIAQLDTLYALTPEQIEQYQRNGYIKLKDVFDEPTINYWGDVFMCMGRLMSVL